MSEFNNVMNRIMKLQTFEVMVDVPDDFQFNGVVPFDMTISAGKAFVTVVAADIQEAVDRVNQYFSGPPEEQL